MEGLFRYFFSISKSIEKIENTGNRCEKNCSIENFKYNNFHQKEKWTIEFYCANADNYLYFIYWDMKWRKESVHISKKKKNFHKRDQWDEMKKEHKNVTWQKWLMSNKMTKGNPIEWSLSPFHIVCHIKEWSIQ